MKRRKTALICMSIIFLLLLGVGITLTWITSRSRNTAEDAAMSATISGTKLRVANYYSLAEADAGSASEKSRAQSGYTEIDENGFQVSDLEPGASVYFRTVITNYTTKEITVSLSLTDVYFSTSLRGYIHFVSDGADIDDDTYAGRVETAEYTVEGSSQQKACCLIATVPIAGQLIIPAGDGTVPGAVEIAWEIRIDEKVEEWQDVWLRIGKMQVDAEGN